MNAMWMEQLLLGVHWNSEQLLTHMWKHNPWLNSAKLHAFETGETQDSWVWWFNSPQRIWNPVTSKSNKFPLFSIVSILMRKHNSISPLSFIFIFTFLCDRWRLNQKGGEARLVAQKSGCLPLYDQMCRRDASRPFAPYIHWRRTLSSSLCSTSYTTSSIEGGVWILEYSRYQCGTNVAQILRIKCLLSQLDLRWPWSN